MAVNKTVNKRTNSHGTMRNCIEYVLRQDKTCEQLAYVTGPYCHDAINYDLVYQTFLEEKKLWNKNRQVCTDGSGRNVIPADSGYRGNYPLCNWKRGD